MQDIDDGDAAAYQAEDAAEEDSALYAWEGIYERPWEKVEQASDGTLLSSFRSRYKTRRAQLQPGVKRAVMRSLVLVIDGSRSAGEPDPEMPTRLKAMVDAASSFVRDFFDQNPISTLALLTMRDGRAEQLTESSCNPRQHLQALAELGAGDGKGEASLQNALELSRESLQTTPSFTSREVLMLCASLSTCDPGDSACRE